MTITTIILISIFCLLIEAAAISSHYDKKIKKKSEEYFELTCMYNKLQEEYYSSKQNSNIVPDSTVRYRSLADSRWEELQLKNQLIKYLASSSGKMKEVEELINKGLLEDFCEQLQKAEREFILAAFPI